MFESITELLLNFSGLQAYFAVFFALLICGLGLPLPEDITLFGAGLLAYYGLVNVHAMVVLSVWGVLFGDSLTFALGYYYGPKLRKYWPFRRILSDGRFNELKQRFQERGNKVIFAGRFMPGLRAPIFFTAGTIHLPYRVFLFYNGLATFISVPLIIYAVFYFGDEVERVFKVIRGIEYGILAFILILIALLVVRYIYKKRHQ